MSRGMINNLDVANSENVLIVDMTYCPNIINWNQMILISVTTNIFFFYKNT